MKLLKNSMYLTKDQWRKVFLALSIMTLVIYTIAMVVSLCGGTYFILNYQNAKMDRIEAFLRKYKIISLLSWLFSTLEFTIVQMFVFKGKARPIFIAIFYIIPVITAIIYPPMPLIVYSIFGLVLHLVSCFVIKPFNKKTAWLNVLRVVVGTCVTLTLQAMITVIKAGYFDGTNHIMNLSAHIIYAIEYDIALSVILCTVSLCAYREKGDNKSWAIYHTLGGSSHHSTKQLQKSNMKKNLTKTQRNKIRLFYVKLYSLQLGAFALVMVLPFLLGKVLEFLIMYLAFAVTRYILGFKYSLHYKKETLCITVGVVVFGVLSLVVLPK